MVADLPVPPATTQAEWCARGMGLPVALMLSMCCSGGKRSCFDVSLSIGSKCCRQHMGGFYGFLMADRAFGPYDLSILDDALWSLKHIRVLTSTYNSGRGAGNVSDMFKELENLDVVVRDADSSVVSLRNAMWPTSHSLAERVAVHSPLFYYSLFHPFSEIVNQGLWELAHYKRHAEHFRTTWNQRTALRYGSHPCEQVEAGKAGILADHKVVKWIANRWASRGLDALSSFVNLGARDGAGGDPLYEVLQNHHVSFALAVEMNDVYCTQHRKNLPHVTLLCLRIDSDSLPSIVEHLPPSLRSSAWEASSLAEKYAITSLPALDMLKVDLDHADCDVIAGFLRLVPVKFIVTEVYDGIPPPFRFAVHESSALFNLTGFGNPTPWGCSISYQVHMLGAFGYQLAWYSAENAVFVHRSAARFLDLPSPLDEVDCYSKNVVMTWWPDGRRLRRWFYEEQLSDALQDLRSSLQDSLSGLAFTIAL